MNGRLRVIALTAALVLLAVEFQTTCALDDMAYPKQICLTFDDLPVVRVHDPLERQTITDDILFALEEHGVQAAGFVVGDNIEGDTDILYSWRASGHLLGNHTYAHSDLNELPAKFFLEDIRKGFKTIETILDETGQEAIYFRYPCLHYGNTSAAKEVVARYLSDKGYTVAHVSIDTDDFAYNLKFEALYKAADSIGIIRLGNEYFDHIMERIKAAEKLADDLIGRPIKHILLLHANRLNAAFLDDLLTEITACGYRFISLNEALSDPVYSIKDTYIGPKGLSILERIANSDPDLLPAAEGH